MNEERGREKGGKKGVGCKEEEGSRKIGREEELPGGRTYLNVIYFPHSSLIHTLAHMSCFYERMIDKID